MKRNITLLLTIIGFVSFGYSQIETIAQWTFPTGTSEDAMPDLSSQNNANQTVFTEGGTSAIDFSKNGESTKAAQATGWDSGMDTKSWQISINTTGYENILLSSMITAGTNGPGPKEFKIQYKIGESGTWTDVTAGLVTTANDWTTGVTEDIALPTECNDETLVYIRWVMASNTSIIDTDVESDGKSKIDNIVIKGEAATGIIPSAINELSIYPNPSTGIINIHSIENTMNIKIFDITGKEILNSDLNSSCFQFDLSDQAKGIYVIKIQTLNNKTYIRRLTIR